ncbi:Transposase [Marinobacterium lacunae]|uniref:Transposase n=1 Tax=Marinobacterium lacunae TaxID=1232683 RepID=A0A081FTI9_9GAMM|nr:Mu transposase C-terminal domain-containing protein [Marinobacterium lacunae]KEA61844.1 Transposase [Marinobacterium lacunae]
MRTDISIEQADARQCRIGGDLAKITRVDDTFIVVNSTGIPFLLSEHEFNGHVQTGFVSFDAPQQVRAVVPSLSPDDHYQVEYWKPYLTAMDRENYPGSVAVRERVIHAVSLRHAAGKPAPKPSTLYNYYRRYLAAGRSVLAVVNSTQKPSEVRANPALIALFSEVMDDHYLKPTGALSLLRCHQIMQKNFNELSSNKAHPLASEKMISRSQFYNWANHLLLSPKDLSKKLSNKERTVMRRKAVQKFKLDQILERVEVDAATINIGLLDDDGNYLGAPLVYAMIDCYSRSIIGLHVQVGGGERSSSVLHLYRQMLAPNQEAEQYGCENDWPMCGIPSTLVSDSGPGFSSHQVSAFLSQVHIADIKAEVRKPWKKPFVERFFQTCRTQLFSTLNGYVGKRKDQKELDINMKDAACMTLRQFREILIRYIVDDYHQRPHRGLNEHGAGSLTPYQVWKSQARFVPSNIPANAEQFHYIKGVVETRKLQREGVSANGITYQSDELDAVVKEYGLQYPVPCTVLVDDEDVGSVTVLFNDKGVKLIVPAKEDFDHLTGKSVHEYKTWKNSAASQQAISELGQQIPVDETPVHQAANAQKPRKKAKAHNRKTNIDAIQEQAGLMTEMGEADYFDPAANSTTHNDDVFDADDDEEGYESV